MDDGWMMAYAVIGGDRAGGPAGGRKQRARLERVGGYVLSQTLVVAADIENPFCRRRRRLRIIGVACLHLLLLGEESGFKSSLSV
jgi:hypothetical protein